MTQQTAASAEESASASEELTAQAEQMRSYVGDLAAAVGSKSVQETGNLGGRNSGVPNAVLSKSTPITARKTGTGGKPELPAPKRPRPSRIIPLEEEGFKDF